MYWAPEIIAGTRYTSSSDIWALGITFYQVCTGEHPFNVRDEQAFKEDVVKANIDWSRLAAFRVLKPII
jgi:serine/threonine protein kinase